MSELICRRMRKFLLHKIALRMSNIGWEATRDYKECL
jgi:hypothetical protein